MVASRREFIGLGAAAVASGVLHRHPEATAGPARSSEVSRALETGELAVLAITKMVGSGYVGLVETATDRRRELRHLVAAPDGTLEPVAGFGPPLPDDVTPVAVAATPGDVLVGGYRTPQVGQVPTLEDGRPEQGVVEVVVPVYGQTACLLFVTAGEVTDVELPRDLADLSFSVVESLLPGPDDGRGDGGALHALVAHDRGHVEARYAAELVVLTIRGGSVVDTVDVARDLGESGPNLMAPSPAGRSPEVLVNRADATYERLAAGESNGGVQTVAAPRPGRVVACFEQGCLVEEVAPSPSPTVRWDTTGGRPAPPAVEELLATSVGRPRLLPVAGEPGRAAALSAGRVMLVDL